MGNKIPIKDIKEQNIEYENLIKYISSPIKELNDVKSVAAKFYYKAFEYQNNQDPENYLISLIASADLNYGPAMKCFEMEFIYVPKKYPLVIDYCEKNKRTSTYAYFYLGLMWYYGYLSFIDNDSNAHEIFKLAAIKGNIIAITYLAMMYHSGYNICQDYEKAYDLHLFAAKKGSITALYNLATMYQRGLYVQQDHSKASILHDMVYEKMKNKFDLELLTKISQKKN
jgi:TPR repeat protein